MRIPLDWSRNLFLASLLWGLATLWISQLWAFHLTQAGFALALVIAATHFRTSHNPFHGHPALWLPASVALLGMLQFALHLSPVLWETRRAAYEWAASSVAASLAYFLYQDRRRRERLLGAFVNFATALALYSVLQNYAAPGTVFGVFDSGYPNQVFGPFLYHSKFAHFIELAVAPALWLGYRFPSERLWYWPAAALLLAAAAASQSRGGAIVLGLEVALLGSLILARTPFFRALLWVASGLLLACLAAILFGGETLLARLDPAELTRDGRWAIFKSSVHMLAAAPASHWLHGSGLGSWPALYPAFAQFDNGSRINQAHCDWLQWTIEGGLPMLALTASIWILALRAARRQWWCFGFVFVWVHGLFDYPMQQTPSFAALQFAFWGLAIHELRDPPVGHEISSR